MINPSQQKNYQIQDDVLLTDNGISFLIGGNHSVLDYITERATPSIESLDNFKLNIARRAYFSKLAKCQYLHVIFPDKQSVLSAEFPIKAACRLGDKYINHIEPEGLDKLVLYPADFLRGALGQRSFESHDTHLSDSGSLVVLSRILDALGIKVSQALKTIHECINLKRKTAGDLGNRFSPPLIQESLTLNPNWNHTKFGSNGLSNNGQIDIYFSPDSTTDKKVLIFGDSFFRLMLPQLSKIFKQVVFLRTPYFHTEMVELTRPDIVLTGNAERYLANVSSDLNAPAFQMYAYTHNSNSKPSSLFLNAFRAVTSPNSASSVKFFTELFDDTAQQKIMIGPSHMVRWAQHVTNGLLRQPQEPGQLIGFGGAPVWSSRLFDKAKQECPEGSKILLMVGDFRFGNDVALNPTRDSLPIFLPNLSGINAKAITPGNDDYMRERAHRALEAWNKHFKNQIHFLFWDLFCRQVQDRLAGRHIHSKEYRHPHWNLDESQSKVPAAKLIDLSPLLKLPMHEVMRLFIDPSSHPSQIGYLTITNCFNFGTDSRTAFNKAVNEVERSLLSSATQLVARKKRPILLCGRSVWLDTLLRYLGQTGREKLSKIGAQILTVNVQVGHSKDPVRPLYNGTNYCRVFISDDGDQSKISSDLRQNLASYGTDRIISIAWEASCFEIISKRNETPLSLHDKNYSKSNSSNCISVLDADTELGPYAYPTFTGLLKLFDSI
ncbi:hypothetical protein [Pseudomonas juntendi]